MDTTALLQGGMRLSLCLLLGITVVLALGWKPRMEYTYQVDGRTVVGIINHNQRVGIHYRGTLIVQTYSSTILFERMVNVTYWRIHEELSEGWWSESSRSSQEKFSEIPMTNSTFIVKLKTDGELEAIYTDIVMQIQDWEKNIYFGIATQMQIQTSPLSKGKLNAIHGSDFSAVNSWKTVMENTTFGRCETMYEVTRVPNTIKESFPERYLHFDVCKSKQYYEIHKTTNLTNCADQVETHFGLPETTKCDPSGNYCGGFWNRAPGSRTSLCRNKQEFIPLQFETNFIGSANLLLTNESMASVSSYIAMNLMSISPLKQRLSLPSLRAALSPGYQYTTYDFTSVNSYLDLKSEEASSNAEVPVANSAINCVDDASKCNQTSENASKPPTITTSFGNLPPFDFEHPPEEPLSAIFLHEKECPTVNTQIEKFKAIISEIASDLEDPQNIPKNLPLEKLIYAIQLCRAMSGTSLKKAIGRLMDKPMKNNNLLLAERRLYIDVLLKCGTAPPIGIIIKWIRDRIVTGEAAARLIASLPEHLRDPRPQIVEALYNITQLEPVQEDRQLTITANLALSNFIRIACVSKRAREVRFPRTVLSPACTLKDIEPYLTWFKSQVDAQPLLTRAFALALGNTGSHDSLYYLKNMATSDKYSAYLRATAVVAMKYQSFYYPEEASNVLFTLFKNYSLPIPVRISAVSMIFYSQPPYVMWQSIAFSTWYEPSTSVAGFVRSSLLTLSKFRDPHYASMAMNARRVVPYSKPINSTLQLSSNWVFAIIIVELQEVLAFQKIMTNEIDAGSRYFRATRRISQLTRLPFDGEIWLSNKDEFLTMIMDWVYPHGNTSDVRPPIKGLEMTTSYVREVLSILHRQMPPIEGEVHGTVDKLTERLFVFDKDYIEEWLKGFEQSTNPIQFNYHNMDYVEFEFRAVTELGFPLSFTHYEPRIVQFNAEFKGYLNPTRIEPNITLVYAEQHIGKQCFYTPWDQASYCVESHINNNVHIPTISSKAQVDAETQRITFEAQTKVAENGHLLLHHNKQTLTSHRHVEDNAPSTHTRTWKPVHLNPSSQVSKSFKGRHFDAHVNYSTPHPYILHTPSSLYDLWMMFSSRKFSNIEIWLSKVPNVKIETERGSAKIKNWKINMGCDTDKSRNETKSTSTTIIEDLISQIEIGTNFTRKIRTIPSGSVRPTDKPTAAQTAAPPTSTTRSPIKEILSNMISETAREVVEEVIQLVKEKQNTETTPNQPASSFFDASIINLTETRDYSAYLLRESLSGISDGESKLIYINITLSNPHKPEQQEGKYGVYMVHAESESQRRHNLGVFLKEETAPKIWEIGWTSNLMSPYILYLNIKDIQKKNFEAVLFSSLQYRLLNEYYNTGLQVHMHRSDKRMEAVNKQLTERQCSDIVDPICRELAYEAMLSDFYNVSLIYSTDEPYLAPLAKRLVDITKLHLLHYGSETQLKNRSANSYYNIINMELDVAEDLSSFNLQADTNTENLVYQNIPVQPELMKKLLYNPRRSTININTKPTTCGMTLSKVSTFDEVVYNYNMTKRWHVMAKDATGKTRFMILTRESEDGKIEIQWNVDNYLAGIINASGVHVQEGQKFLPVSLIYNEYKDLNGTVLLRVWYTKLPEVIAHVECPEHGFDFSYSTTTVLIQAQESTRGRPVGLCGDNNGEKIAEFQTPKKVIVTSPQVFAESYALPDDTDTTGVAPPSSTPTSEDSSS